MPYEHPDVGFLRALSSLIGQGNQTDQMWPIGVSSGLMPSMEDPGMVGVGYEMKNGETPKYPQMKRRSKLLPSYVDMLAKKRRMRDMQVAPDLYEGGM